MYYNINYETLKEIYDTMKLKRKIKNRVFITYDLDGNRHEVWPKHIEKIFLINDYVLNAIVVKKKDDIKKNVPVVFVILRDGINISDTISELLMLAMLKLHSYEIPVDFKVTKELPKTNDDKIDYKKLEDICNEEYTQEEKRLYLK